MKKVTFATFLLALFVGHANAQQVVLTNYNGKLGAWATSKDGQVDERGKALKMRQFKKETGVVGGLKVIEYGGINWLFDLTPCSDYSGIQGFPDLSSVGNIQLNSEITLLDAEIINRGFFTNTDIKKITFSSTLKRIDDDAFSGCENLEEIVFLGGCDNIEMSIRAFPVKKEYNGTYNTNIKKIKVPMGKITEYVKKLDLPESLFDDGSAVLKYDIRVEKPGTILNQLSVDKLNSIRSLTITGILDERDLAIIKRCNHLEELDLSHTYTTLSEDEQKKRHANQAFLQGMFQAMGELSEEQYKNGEIGTFDNLQVQLFAEMAKDANQVKNGSEGCIIVADAFRGMTNLVSVKLPYRATVIEANAFSGCYKLTNVECPLYLKEIRRSAFENCISIPKILFPPTLSGIAQTAFDGCTALESVDLSKCTFTDKEWYVRFKDCIKISVIHLPRGVVRIGVAPSALECYIPADVKRIDDTFNNVTLHFEGENPPAVKEVGWSHVPRGCTIYVPKGCMTAYYAVMGDNNTLKEE